MSQSVTRLSDLNLDTLYTYADYLTWQFQERVELLRGKLWEMSPAPNTKHQRISSNMHTEIGFFLKKHPCRLFAAPFDVRLFDVGKSVKANKDIYTVVQPDLCVVCDAEKLDERGCLGAPDLIVEILSPGNSKREMKAKYALYQESGVREYWVVYPSEHVVQQFVRNEQGVYALKNSFAEDETFYAHVFPELQINLSDIFRED